MGQCRRFYRDTVTAPIWTAIYRKLEESGRLGASFPGCADPSLDFFLDLLARDDRHSWVLTFDREIAGVFYLSDLEGTSARAHFAFLPTEMRRTKAALPQDRLPVPVAVARFILASVLRDRYQEESGNQPEYVLDTLVGITPVRNTAAVNMVMRCGSYPMGIIPHACPDVNGRNTDGFVTYYTRETTEDGWRFL